MERMMVSFETYEIVTIMLGKDSLFSKDYKIYHNFIIDMKICVLKLQKRNIIIELRVMVNARLLGKMQKNYYKMTSKNTCI